MTNEYIRVFRAFSDEKRVRILEMLCEGERCACSLLVDLEISQATLSHHMKILCQSGLVNVRKEGWWNHYSINAEGCHYASKMLDSLANKDMKRWLGVAGFIHQLLHPFRHWKPARQEESDCCCQSDGIEAR